MLAIAVIKIILVIVLTIIIIPIAIDIVLPRLSYCQHCL